MGNIGTWQLVIVLAIVLLLFGAKRLPEAARGLGRSLKIFKTETQGLIGDDKDEDKSADAAADKPAPAQQTQRAVEPTTQPAEQRTSEPVSDKTQRDA